MKQTLTFHHMTAKPSEQIGTHEHPEWELSYILSGRGIRTVGCLEEPFKRGEVVLVPPDVPHGWAFSGQDQEVENISLFFADNALQQLGAFIPELKSIEGWLATQHEALCFTGWTLTALQSILKRMDGESDARRITSLLELLNVIVESQEHRSVGRLLDKNTQRLERIQLYINCNYNHGICIDSIARHIGMNRSSLCTFYRRQTGQTLVEVVNVRRLAVARNLLRRRDLTIQQVCFESGFNDIPYFYRLFKRTEGMTPKEYQKQLKKSS